MLIALDEGARIARLFRFLILGERLAQNCAHSQARLSSHAAWRRFFSAQSRQEAFHVTVLDGAIRWLSPRGDHSNVALKPMEDYGRLIDEALKREDLAETVLAQQVILEGLGEFTFDRISDGISDRGLGFRRIRRLLQGQELAHHRFGMRYLEKLESPENTLKPRAQDYMGLALTMLDELHDLLEYFGEDPALYVTGLYGNTPWWVTASRQRLPRQEAQCAT